MKSGASESSVEITIEIDKKSNILRAVATGATEFKMSDSSSKNLSSDELHAVATKSLHLPAENVVEVAATGKKHSVHVLDKNGVVCLQREGKAFPMVLSGNNYRGFSLITVKNKYDLSGSGIKIFHYGLDE